MSVLARVWETVLMIHMGIGVPEVGERTLLARSV